MPRGGARTRSGPPADPTSGRSQRRQVNLQELPAKGNSGRAPAYPLVKQPVKVYIEGVPVVDPAATAAFRKRELEVWRELWKSPQAVAWSLPENTWRRRLVALYCRVSVRCEAVDASPSLINQLRGLGHEIAMTHTGLVEQGWQIESTAVSGAAASPAKASAAKSARERGGLTLVASGGAT